MNLNRALDSIAVKRRYSKYRGERVGRVVKDFCDGFYKRGEVVLFRRDGDGFFSVEKPLSIWEMRREKRKGSVVSSVGLVCGVPKGYVGRVRRR
jgi:hypothetical protein